MNALPVDSLLKNVKLIEDKMTESAMFYELIFKSYSELVLAFQCPTIPPIYLQIFRDTDEELKIWVIINERDVFLFFEDVED